ncbi:MAG: holo-ACP synthase [Candidatus Limnocylindrales bacterium]
MAGAGRSPGTGDDAPDGGGARDGYGAESPAGFAATPPPETTELGIDIIRVSRIAASLNRFGDRFTRRVLTPAEAAYVRNRPETMAGRWAAKEAVSKVLGLGVRGIGWRDIEVERLPTGQPAIRLHGRAERRAIQLGMGRVAVSISHESEFAVAIAYGVRTAGGRYLFPPDIEERLGEREAALLRRLERLRGLAREAAAAEAKLSVTDAARPAGPAVTRASEEQPDA